MLLDIVVTTASAGLGLMLTGFAGLNLVGDFVGGTFFNKFIFEMDRVMGGQLGIPHYSKVEFCMLALGAAGAWTSVFSDSTDLARQPLSTPGCRRAELLIRVYENVLRPQQAAVLRCTSTGPRRPRGVFPPSWTP